MRGNRSVAIDRLEAVARSEEAELSRGGAGMGASAAGAGASGGWTGGGDDRGGSRPTTRNAAVSRLEQRLEMKERALARDGAAVGVAPEMTANIRRKIQFLQDCDWWVHNVFGLLLYYTGI